jgi:adenylate cyclase
MQELKSEGTYQGPNTPSSAEIRAALDRILASPAFVGSRRPGNFLKYVVEETLEGREEKIKEYSIATDVFGRDQSFDPRMDPIVRVEATKLRSRLAHYYEQEGQRDAIRIEFPKRGYVPAFRFQAIEDWASEATSPIAADNRPSVAMTQGAVFSRRTAFIAAGLVLACVVAFALTSLRSRPFRVPESKSIAVLPFTNLGENKEDEYFSDGLTDELIASLGRVPGLRVVARGSAFQFKNRTYDIRDVGRRLNVRTVLEGSVRKVGTRLRITVHLDDSTNGYRIWSDIYERDSSDALAIQREIATALATSLGMEFDRQGTVPGSESTGTNASVNPEAYQAYLKGLFFWNKNTAISIRTAIDYFQEAARKDPTYAPIYTGLGRCYAGLPVFTPALTEEVIPKIREVASKALSLDPRLGEAHMQLGEAAFLEYKWAEAEHELKLALELSPGDAVIHRFYSYYLGRMGRSQEALSQTLAAQDLDPVSPYLAEGVGQAYLDLRRYDDAIQQFKNTLKLDPNYAMAARSLGIAYVYRGDYEKGIEELERAAKLDPEDISVNGELGYAYALSGRRAAAEKTLSILLDQVKHGTARPIRVAQVYIGLGDRDHAFAWFEKAVDQHEISFGPKTDAMFDPLRSDPRFTALLRRMNLN